MRHALALAALFAATATQAADIKFLIPERENHPAIVTFHGPLKAGDENTFHNVTLGVQHAVVFLDCPGGDLTAAIDIGWSIRQRNFPTALTDNAICSSACAIIWLAGTTRYLGVDSRIGFHSAAVRTKDGYKRSDSANRRVAAYLEHLGYPPHLIDYMTEAEPQFFTWLSPFYATKYKIYSHELSELNNVLNYAEATAPIPTALELKRRTDLIRASSGSLPPQRH
jgi:hypothetical protein